MAYLLDANVFIQAKNLHYGLDFAPGFWDWLVRAHDAGTVRSVEKVGDELKAGDDELARWAEERGPSFFSAVGPADVMSLGNVAEWVNAQSYDSAAVAVFLQAADFYLVAQAQAGRHTVVTHEVPSNSPKKVKIPNVCIGLGISCISTWEMLRRERVRLVLGGVQD